MLKDILQVVAALCEPLAYVHGRGVVHRDLKPDNVVIDGAGAPILVDFGLASMAIREQSRDVLDVAGRALGTPAYMARTGDGRSPPGIDAAIEGLPGEKLHGVPGPTRVDPV
ncbi:MAG: protein kinase, partial [Myxococcota bacterium]